MKKAVRIIALLLTLSLLSTGAAFAANPFSGVSSWAETDVKALYSTGSVPEAIMKSFKSPITRGEFTSIIIGAYEYIKGSAADTGSSSFKDISSNPYKTQIQKAYSLKIINGLSDIQFAPDNGIVRQEAAKILYTFSDALGVAGELKSYSLTYSDAGDVSAWAVNYVGYATENGLMNGTGTGFEPGGSLTREQAIVIINRLVESIKSAEVPAVVEDTAVTYRSLSVGVSDYQGTKNDGNRFTNDSTAISKRLSFSTTGYEVNVISNPGKEEFWAKLKEVFSLADSNDVTVLTLSCHGFKAGDAYGPTVFENNVFALSDGEENYFITYVDLFNYLSTCKGTKVLLLGSCYSGAAAALAKDDNSILVLTACKADEQSYGVLADDGGHSIFEEGIVEAFGGSGTLKADTNKDGKVTFNELVVFITDYISDYAPEDTYFSPLYKGNSEVALYAN